MQKTDVFGLYPTNVGFLVIYIVGDILITQTKHLNFACCFADCCIRQFNISKLVCVVGIVGKVKI